MNRSDPLFGVSFARSSLSRVIHSTTQALNPIAPIQRPAAVELLPLPALLSAFVSSAFVSRIL
jgi:hypothetical protein